MLIIVNTADFKLVSIKNEINFYFWKEKVMNELTHEFLYGDKYYQYNCVLMEYKQTVLELSSGINWGCGVGG